MKSLIVPQEQLNLVKSFSVRRITNVISDFGMTPPNTIPGHSLLELEYENILTSTGRQNLIGNDTSITSSNKRYKLDSIPESYMNNPEVLHALRETIERIDNEINQRENVSGAYQQFCDFIRNEMDKHIEWSVPSIKNRPKKSRYKPHWNDDLQEQWSVVRAAELEWLRCDPNCFTKRRLKERYCLERRNFDRMNRRFKRQFQISKQNELSDLCVNNSESRNFWKYIGKLGIGYDRRNMIPWETIEYDEVVSDKERVLRKWRQDYERLFRENGDNRFDDEHLNNVRSILNDGSDNTLLANGTECSQLNYPITRNEVIDAVSAAKTRKAVGVDEIPAEVLKNDICVDILFKLISACFELHFSLNVPSKISISHALFQHSR